IGAVILLQGPAAAPAQPASQPASQPDGKVVARAREMLKFFLDRQFDEFVAQGSVEMKAHFTAPQAESAYGRIREDLGDYRSEISADVQRSGGFDVVVFKLQFQRGTVPLRVVVDRNDHLGGFW